MTLESWLEDKGYSQDDINKKGPYGYTALMRAAKDGEVEMVRRILALPGLDLAATNDDGNNAVWNGCFADSEPIVSMLIEAGVDVDNINDNGVTALMYTASSGKEPITKLLIEKGADITIKNLDDFTALDLASTRNTVMMLRKAMGR